MPQHKLQHNLQRKRRTSKIMPATKDAVTSEQLFEAIQRAAAQSEVHMDNLQKEMRNIADRLLKQEIFQDQTTELAKELATRVDTIEDQRIAPLEAAQKTQGHQIEDIIENRKNRWQFANAVMPTIISVVGTILVLLLTGQLINP